MKGARPLDNNEIRLSSRSLKTISDETLFLELGRRGYDLAGLRRENTETDTHAEIVKIS